MTDAHRTSRLKPWQIIVLFALIAATLDLAAACVQSWVLRERSPVFVLHSIASGILGAGAWQQGWPAAVLGFVAHYGIIVVAAFLLWFASRRIAFITSQPYIAGPLYGAIIFVVMNYVVVPLSAAPFTMQYTPTSLILQLSFHLFLVGLPLAFGVREARR